MRTAVRSDSSTFAGMPTNVKREETAGSIGQHELHLESPKLGRRDLPNLGLRRAAGDENRTRAGIGH
jgi:hypothetical protein